jgi:hypothetical protein
MRREKRAKRSTAGKSTSSVPRRKKELNEEKKNEEMSLIRADSRVICHPLFNPAQF